MGNQDKFILLIRKSKAFICILVDDRSHKNTPPNCWCFRNSVSYSAIRWLCKVFLIRRLNSAKMPDASTAAPLVMLFDSFRHGGHCSVAPRMGFGVTRQRSYSALWQALVFQVPLKGLVPFQTRFKIFRRTWSTSGRRCRSKNFYGILLLEIPGFREASFP